MAIENPDFEKSKDKVLEQDVFGVREVGISHPDLPCHFRITDDGVVEIVVGSGLGMMFDPSDRSITINADKVNFMTSEDGFIWNGMQLNSKANSFNEPTFLSRERDAGIYRGVDYYIEEELEKDKELPSGPRTRFSQRRNI